ncbi:archease, partial [Capsaspora owczarzaki ATCC 30864]
VGEAQCYEEPHLKRTLNTGGDSLAEAFVQVVYAMYGYMTDTDKADIFLFNFCTEFLVVKTIEMIEFDATNFKIKAIGRGETFDKAKHGQGTEVKAITYSNMQIHQDPATGKCDIYVIVDI